MPLPFRQLPFRLLLAAAACASLGGCFDFGAGRLYRDQLGYSRALGDSENAEMLLNVVRIRYGATPTFLQATQVISAYQLQRNLAGGLSFFPSTNGSDSLNGSVGAQLQQSPTFTFQPLYGEQFAQSLVQPLAPADLLPLAEGGLPVDVLFRLGVQSINGHSNAVALAQNNAAGSPGFFELLYDLRQLQMGGLLGVSLQQPAPAAGGHPDPGPGHVMLSIGKTSDPTLRPIAARARLLLGMAPAQTEAEIVYGHIAGPGQIPILTRSMLGALSQLAIQADVPAADIAEHRTQPTVGEIGLETRPVVIIRSGPKAPDDAYTSAEYRGTWYWIDDDDFDSKLAFTVLQTLMALSRGGNAPGAVLTIPTG